MYILKYWLWHVQFILISFQKQKNDNLYISYSLSLIHHIHDCQLYLLFPIHMKNHKQMLFYKLFETY